MALPIPHSQFRTAPGRAPGAWTLNPVSSPTPPTVLAYRRRRVKRQTEHLSDLHVFDGLEHAQWLVFDGFHTS